MEGRSCSLGEYFWPPYTRVVAKHEVVGLLFSWPTLTHPSAPSPGHCSRSAPPACMKGSSRSQTHWRKCCRATLGLVVSPALTSLRQDQEGLSTLGTIPALHPSTAALLTAPTSARRTL